MHPRTAQAPRERRVAVEHDASAGCPCHGDESLGKPLQTLDRPRFLAQLDEPQAAGDRRARTLQKRLFAKLVGHRDAIDCRQLERAENRRVGGQQWLDVECPRRLPRGRLPVAPYGFAAPRENAKETELDVCVRIDVAPDEPRRGAGDFDPQLLVELARERFGD